MRFSSAAFAVFVSLSAASTAFAGDGDSRVIVGFKGAADTVAAVRSGLDVEDSHDQVVVGTVAASRIAGLRADPAVAYVEEDAIAQVCAQSTPWGVSKVWGGTMPAATGANIKVAIIDTGIDLTHQDLAANIGGNVTFVAGTTTGNDDHGHGSHVAGIVAAVNDSNGVVGVASGAKLYAVKVLDQNGSGYLSAVASGLDWARTNGMKIANMSLGSSSNSTTLSNACNSAFNAGVLLIAAAGNSGDGNVATTETSYPAAYTKVVAVGATNSSDGLASFSNTGAYVFLSAPGVSIYSTYKNGGYGTLSGTSMAAPHAAGLAALIWNTVSTNGNVAANVRYELHFRVRDFGTAGKDNGFGYGIVSYPITSATYR